MRSQEGLRDSRRECGKVVRPSGQHGDVARMVRDWRRVGWLALGLKWGWAKGGKKDKDCAGWAGAVEG